MKDLFLLQKPDWIGKIEGTWYEAAGEMIKSSLLTLNWNWYQIMCKCNFESFVQNGSTTKGAVKLPRNFCHFIQYLFFISKDSSVYLLVHDLQIREWCEVGCWWKKRQAPSNLQVGTSALCTRNYWKLWSIIRYWADPDRICQYVNLPITISTRMCRNSHFLVDIDIDLLTYQVRVRSITNYSFNFQKDLAFYRPL